MDNADNNPEEVPQIIERELEVLSYNDEKQKVLNHVITIKDKMGEGSFSKVYQVDYLFKWDEEGETKEMTLPYAMKVLDTDQLSKKYSLSASADNDKKTYLDIALEELAIFRKIRHDNIIKVFEIIHGEGKLYMVMELANIGSVLTWDNTQRKYSFTPEIKKYIEERAGEILSQETVDWESIKDRELVAKYIFKQLFDAVSYIHEKNIVHRDIKWENILAKFNSEEQKIEFKLIDFSVGKILDSKDSKVPKFEGTLEYGAPDATSGEPYDAMKADIWALGVCLYSLIWGNLPQESHEGPYLDVIQKSEDVSEELKELLQGMLQSDPDQRSTIEDLTLSLWLL